MTWQGHPRGSSGYRRVLVALLAAGVAAFAQVYSPQGILTLMSADLGASAAQVSLMIGATTSGIALAVIPWSLAADRLGRVQTMRIALIIAAVIGLITPWIPGIELLIPMRLLQGIAIGGVPGVAMAYLTEEVSGKNIAAAAGSFVAGNTLGGLAGRLLAAPIADVWGWRLGMFAAALLVLVATIVFILAAPVPQGFAPHASSLRQMLGAVKRHTLNPRLAVLYAQAFLLMGGYVAIYNYLGFRLELAPFFLPAGVASLLFLAYLAGTVSSRVSSSFVARLGRGRSLLTFIAVMVAGVLMTLAPSLIVMLVGLTVLTAGFFGAHTVAVGWSGTRALHNRAQSTSLYNFCFYVGSTVFGYLGGFAWQALGWGGVVLMVTGLAVIAACLALFAARERE